MAKNGLRQLLELLQLTESGSVYFYNHRSKWEKVINPDTGKRIEKIEPDAFYVFNNQPYILFFDLTEEPSNQGREEKIHKQVWSFDQSPLIFIVKDTDVEVFNAFSFNKRNQKLDQITLTEGETLADVFSFWNLQSGATWKWLQERYYEPSNIRDKRVNQKLFENIRAVREALTSQENETALGENEANIFILRLIFIRYLIDRGVKLDESYISGTELNERRKSLVDLIGKPKKLNEFFEWLNEKFNGVLFKDIKTQLSGAQAKQLAYVFKGEIPEGIFQDHDFYFDVFDFGIIPVELISGIYESLIDEDTRTLHSAVYTPSFLVEYILTHTVDKYFQEPKNKRISECKVFDPSVGSGIFLVQAFRRMVDREIALSKDEKIYRRRLKEIVVNNLYGIDINEQALKVTCFSIYIAMLDYFDPNSILPSFKFPDLIGTNLFTANFFDKQHPFNYIVSKAEPDFILGNPPWRSNKDEHHTTWIKNSGVTVGRFEIAQSFLLRSKDFMLWNTKAALIVTSTIFYNVAKTTKTFKSSFLKQFCLTRFFDLSAVRRLVFEEKNSPCAIVFYKLAEGQNFESNIVNHASVKSNLFLKYYKTLVIEKFDQKRITQNYFIENDWMFKVALYGNALDFKLLNKLKKDKTRISDIIDGKTIYKGAGILEGDSEVYPSFEPIIGKVLIENSEVSEFYTMGNPNSLVTKEQSFLKSGRIKGLFEGKQILFKEQARDESTLVISYTSSHCVFRKGVFGIASISEEDIIDVLFCILISNLYTYYIFISSGSWGVSTRPQIRWDEEYLSFAFKRPHESVIIELRKLITSFLQPYIDSKREVFVPINNIAALKKINSIVEELYGIVDYERDLIDYVLTISRYQFQGLKKQQALLRRVNQREDEPVLKSYADVFFKEFGSIYPDEHMQIQVFSLNHFIAMKFTFGKNKPINDLVFENTAPEFEVLKRLADKISISEISKNLYIQKDIKGFEENSFYIIKPNELKCWHRAIAWYDVAEIKKAIEEAEVSYINSDFDV